MKTSEVNELVKQILGPQEDETSHFIPTRYPSTYARDFVRAHPEHFEVAPELRWNINRGEAGNIIRAYAARTNQRFGDVMVALADGYLQEYDERVSDEQRAEALKNYLDLHPGEAAKWNQISTEEGQA